MCIPFVPQRFQAEAWRVIRFLVIGGSSVLLAAFLYYLLSRWIWVSGNRTFENFVSIVIASIFNFLAHRRWTFGVQERHIGQWTRYILVAVSALLIQSFLFWVGERLLHIYDFIVFFAVTALISCYTYFMHKVFTFRVKGAPASEEPPVAVV